MAILKDLHSDLLRTGIFYKQYNLLLLSQVFISERAYGTYSRFSAIKVVKELSLDNLIKFAIFKLSYPFIRRRERLDADYVFVSDVNNKPVIDVLLAVRREFAREKTVLVYFDNRIGVPSHDVVNALEFVSVFDIVLSYVGFLRLLPVFYRGRKDIFSIARKYRVNAFLLLLNTIDSILAIKIIERMLRMVRAPKIILMTDVHKLSRIVTLRAREMKRTTFVIQHGATVGEEGYLPILADRMLAWGEGSKAWFVDHGQEAGKIVTIGSPKMDDVIYSQPSYDSMDNDIQRVLVITSTITFERPFLEAVREAFSQESLRHVEIGVKLHPGISIDFSYIVEEVFQGSGLHYKILKREPLGELLRAANVVIITTSSVGMDAIIYNKPIFQFKAGRFLFYRMSWEESDCSHPFSTGDELYRLVCNAEYRLSKIKNYPSFVRYSFGELDGMASNRIRNFVVNYPTKY